MFLLSIVLLSFLVLSSALKVELNTAKKGDAIDLSRFGGPSHSRYRVEWYTT